MGCPDKLPRFDGSKSGCRLMLSHLRHIELPEDPHSDQHRQRKHQRCASKHAAHWCCTAVIFHPSIHTIAVTDSSFVWTGSVGRNHGGDEGQRLWRCPDTCRWAQGFSFRLYHGTSLNIWCQDFCLYIGIRSISISRSRGQQWIGFQLQPYLWFSCGWVARRIPTARWLASGPSKVGVLCQGRSKMTMRWRWDDHGRCMSLWSTAVLRWFRCRRCGSNHSGHRLEAKADLRVPRNRPREAPVATPQAAVLCGTAYATPNERAVIALRWETPGAFDTASPAKKYI